MTESEKSSEDVVTGKTLWHNSLQSFWAVRKQAGYIIFFTILLPQVLYTFAFDHVGMGLVEQIRNQTDAWLQPGAAGPADLRVLLQLVTPVFKAAITGLLSTGILEVIGMFALIVCLVNYYQARPEGRVGGLLWSGLRFGVPAGLVWILIGTFMFVATQVIFPPLVLLVIPILMAPALMVIERIGPLKAISRSVKFHYAQNYQGGRFVVIMQVFSIAGSIYLAVVALDLLSDFLLNADTYLQLPRTLWQPFTTWVPYSAIFAGVQLLELIVSALLIWYFAAASVSLYMLLDAQHRRLPNGGFLV